MKNILMTISVILNIVLVGSIGWFNYQPTGATVASNIPLTENYVMSGNTLGYAEETDDLQIDQDGDIRFAPTGNDTYTTADFGVGTSSPTGLETYDSTGTTTLTIDAASSKGGCIKIRNNTGTWTYISVTGTTVVASATACE